MAMSEVMTSDYKLLKRKKYGVSQVTVHVGIQNKNKKSKVKNSVLRPLRASFVGSVPSSPVTQSLYYSMTRPLVVSVGGLRDYCLGVFFPSTVLSAGVFLYRSL
jgi:hypothetical protein